MHVMFLHPAFPAQFGMIAHYLTTVKRWPSTFVTSVDTSNLQLSFNHINYRLADDAPQPKEFTNPRNLQDFLDHLGAIYRGLRGVPQIQPDLVVGHMSFGTMLYLRNLYPCHFVGYFNYLPPPFWSQGMVLREEFPPPEGLRLFNSTYHMMTHLHLDACDAAYTPTAFQLSTCPEAWRSKVRILRDGIDCETYKPRPKPTRFRDHTFDPATRIVTYVSRGLESVRGFDIFMQMAKRIAERRQDVRFLVIGGERTLHGHEQYHIGSQTFKQWVLGRDHYDLSRFLFLDFPPVQELAEVFNLSDLHVCLSVPYLPPVTLLPAMASGCTILGSATSPIQEFIENDTHGVLRDFSDVDALVDSALALLDERDRAKHLGSAARQRILERHELNHRLEAMAGFFESFPLPSHAKDIAFSSLHS